MMLSSQQIGDELRCYWTVECPILRPADTPGDLRETGGGVEEVGSYMEAHNGAGQCRDRR